MRDDVLQTLPLRTNSVELKLHETANEQDAILWRAANASQRLLFSTRDIIIPASIRNFQNDHH